MTYEALVELLKDAETCGRLSNWDEDFLASQRARVVQYADRITLSEKQQDVLRRIEEKVYACG